MTFLCAIEAVNLDNFFGDCQDLSTTRGGGLALLEIAKKVGDKLGCPPIASGSSKGLFAIEGTSADEVEERVRNAASGGILQYATVMVAACQREDGAFARQAAELSARIRWSQMRSPSVVYPALRETLVCDIDRVRPATLRADLEEKRNQSDFTFARRQLGRAKKERLLQQLLGGSSGDFDVVEDLEELSDDGGQFGNLGKKIAVLRFDGNSFGAIAGKCETEEDYRLFAETTKKQQAAYFQTLFSKPEWWTKGAHKKPQIEILVYGGDEVTFITPAWLGWKALETFYRESKSWRLNTSKGEVPLTYSGGLVFCHFKAPIHSVRQLASGLADQAKDKAKEELGDKGNFAAYQALESFDSIGQDLDDFLGQRYQHTGERSVFLGLEEIEILEGNMGLWRATLSRRKLHKVVHGILRGEAPKRDDAIAELGESKSAASGQAAAKLRDLHRVLGNAAFLHVLELWDYADVSGVAA